MSLKTEPRKIARNGIHARKNNKLVQFQNVIRKKEEKTNICHTTFVSKEHNQ